MKKKNIIQLIVLLILCIFVCCGCGSDKQKAETRKADSVDDETIQIGMSFDSFVIERWQRDRDVFVSTAKDQGAEVLVQVADGDLDEQKEQIRYFINKKVDAIVVVAVDCSGLSDVVNEAKAAGIYVIAYDRMLLDSNIDMLVTFDNVMVGELMAEAIVRRAKPLAKVICINGSENDNNVSEVQEGFHRVLDETNVKVIYTNYCPNWEAERAYEVMQVVLDDGLKFDAVMCGNDDLATMVYKALSERGMADDVVLVGQDADLAACQRVVKGWQTMTVYKSVESLAREAAMATIQLVKTGEIDTATTVNNGKIDVPAILLKPVAVNKSNMDEVIVDGGFHLHDEIYEQ